MKLLIESQFVSLCYYVERENDFFRTFREKEFDRGKVTGLLKFLSCFDLDTKSNMEKKSDEPFASVVHNLISKGIPTRPSIFIEDQFLKAFGKSQLDTSDFAKQLGNS